MEQRVGAEALAIGIRRRDQSVVEGGSEPEVQEHAVTWGQYVAKQGRGPDETQMELAGVSRRIEIAADIRGGVSNQRRGGDTLATRSSGMGETNSTSPLKSAPLSLWVPSTGMLCTRDTNAQFANDLLCRGWSCPRDAQNDPTGQPGSNHRDPCSSAPPATPQYVSLLKPHRARAPRDCVKVSLPNRLARNRHRH